MIGRDEYDVHFDIFKYDYQNCPLCGNYIHKNDVRCRWCASKKIKKIIWKPIINVLFIIYSIGLLSLGYLNVNKTISLVIIILFSIIFCMTKKERWLKKHLF